MRTEFSGQTIRVAVLGMWLFTLANGLFIFLVLGPSVGAAKDTYLHCTDRLLSVLLPQIGLMTGFMFHPRSAKQKDTIDNSKAKLAVAIAAGYNLFFVFGLWFGVYSVKWGSDWEEATDSCLRVMALLGMVSGGALGYLFENQRKAPPSRGAKSEKVP